MGAMETTTKLPSLAPKPGGAPGPDLAAARKASRVAVASSRKTSTTNHACVQCRRTKTKCDGRHPCSRCQFNGHECAYDTRTLSGDRLNRLTHAFNQQKDRLQQLETILAAMRTGTDAEAAEVMAYIRIGEPVESIVSYLESRSKSVVISERLLGSSGEAQNKFIEMLFDRTEWVQGVTIPTEAVPVDLKTRTQCYISSNFGNLPFSSGIKANHYPAEAQRSQLQNYYAKHNWAMMTANDGHGMASVTKAWADTMNKARQLIATGVKPDELTGAFPAVAALFDKKEYDTASMISKWAVQFIYSSRHEDYSITSMAAVWVVWIVMRWMINPTPDTYSAMPEWIRPTELQVFVPHIDMVDCIIWPYFRDYVIQRPQMQHGGLQWLAACTAGVKVSWAGTVEDALCVDEATGKRRLTAEAEACPL
ncbi:hypothetical protein CDV31_002418 [Fusarium ambrosium]|uniref:Zn(2)-C6 fungal-type domain-containing protein n=1 Tax=Fusarium ambrosium TaxID=131363 RepID=A0A428UWM1_9HYPO|nr:hypothetical protein CDV31_002418 [Fusarium ambrosium]